MNFFSFTLFTKKSGPSGPGFLFTGLIISNLLLGACTSESVKTVSEPDAGLLPSSFTTPKSFSPPNSESGKPFYTGWAIDAYPDMSREQMVTAASRMKKAGANVVWISHANPARSFKDEREVGLNPDVYAAFKDFTRIDHADAVEIVQAQKQMLQICQELNIKAVLSIR